MLRRYSVNFSLFSIALDALLVSLALHLAVLLRPWLSQFPGIIAVKDPILPPPNFYFIFPVIWVLINLGNSLYDGQRNYRIKDEVSWLVVGGLMAMGALAGVLYFSYRDMSRAEFVLSILTAFLLQLVWRLMMRVYWRLTRHNGNGHRHVLIIGAGEIGLWLAQTLHKQAQSETLNIHFIDDDPQKHSHPQVLGSLSDLDHILASRRVDDIIFALPMDAHRKVVEAVIALRTYPMKVWLVPASHRLALYRATIENFVGVPLLDLRAPAIMPYQRMVKRLFDIMFSAVFLFFTSPVMGLIALLIKLDSPGPIFFRQRRSGENGRLFEMLKFRTMVQDAESLRDTVERLDENGNLIHKHRDDPRVTRLGKFLRRYSLDELPQFINVFYGEMSVVGPRPELPYLVEKYDPWQYVRFTVPQGVTGWWQINGRSDKPMHLHTEEDLYYVKNYSFWLDIQILFKTVWIVLRGKGAY